MKIIIKIVNQIINLQINQIQYFRMPYFGLRVVLLFFITKNSLRFFSLNGLQFIYKIQKTQFKSQFLKIMILYKQVLLIVSILVLVIAQQPQQANLNQIYNISIDTNTSKQMKVIIDRQIYNDTQLYISAQVPYDNPFQKPKIAVKSDKNFSYQCQYQANQLMDICSIDTQQLTENRVFTITIYCQNKCNLQFAAYLNDAIIIDIGDEGVLGGLKDFGLAQVVQVRVPKGTIFTQIFVNAQILNIHDVNQGLTLLVNYGLKDSTSIPNLQIYEMKGESTWNDGVGVAISKQLMQPSETEDKILKCYLYTSQNMKVKFSTWIVNGNKFPITLNQQFFDFISYQQDRIYILNLTKEIEKIKDQDIDIIITVFSGSPAIEVAFTQQFNPQKEIKNNFISGRINNLVTPSIREQMGFNGLIYVRVAGFWTTTFKIEANVFSKNFVPLFVDSTQIIHLKKDEVMNLLFKDEVILENDTKNTNLRKKYSVKIEMMGGNVKIGLRRCKEMENSYNTSCLIKQKSELTNQLYKQSFKEIKPEIEHAYSTYQIRFDYDFNNCQKKINRKDNTNVYTCVFQIVVAQADNGTLEKTDFALTLYKRQFSVRLQEGIMVKDTVAEQEYHFYVFSIPILENITQVTFFISTIQGDLVLLGSTEDRYPTMFDVQTSKDKIYFAVQNSLTFSGENLKKTMYLSVFGFQNSDYSLITMVKRQNKQTQGEDKKLTSISLSQGVMMNYQLQVGQDTLLFSFTPKLNKNVRLTIVNRQGSVRYQVKLKDNQGKQQKISCLTPNYCDLILTEQKKRYFVEVTGQKQSVQKFSIGYNYYQQDKCIQYSMNSPLIVTLNANETVCLKYHLKTARQLQFLMSLTSKEFFEKNINATLSIKDKKLEIKEHSRIITTQQQLQICTVDGVFQICPIRIQVTPKQKLQFQMILQQVDIQLALFEGVSQNVVAKGLNQEKGKQFYFDMLTKDGMQIFFTKQEANKYKIIAKVLEVNKYLLSNESQFPKFDAIADKQNIFAKDVNSSVSIVSISSQQIKQNGCESCILLISVYRKVEEQQIIQNLISSFNIEIVQKQYVLNLGQNKVDLVEEGQVMLYYLSLSNAKSDGLLYLSSVHQQSCANLLLLLEDDQVQLHRSFIKLNPGRQYKVGIEGKSSCSFDISLFSAPSQIRQISKNLPQEVSVSEKKIHYFITYHSTNTTFRVIETIKSGASSTYIQTIKNYDNLKQIFNKNITYYTFNEGVQLTNIQIENTNPNFCKDCYYLIAIQGNPNVQEELIVLDEGKRIPLRENTMFKDKVNKQHNKKQYQYHSISTFNITVEVLSGNFTLLVNSPSGIVVVNETVSTFKNYIIQHPVATEDKYVDLLDDKSQYNISVLSNDNDASYSLQIKKHNVSLRIRQGIPITINLNNQTQTIFQFINTDQNTSENNINLLLETSLSNEQNNFKLSDISVTARVQSEKQQVKLPQQLIQQRVESQRSLNIKLIDVQGTYFLTLKLNGSLASTKISIILIKKQITHLIQGQNKKLFDKEGIFELYNSKENLMVEIFNCKGDVNVHASSNYSILPQNKNGQGQVIIEHTNFGNHYVISAPQYQGQYFIQTFKKQTSQDILYKMSYSQYAKNSQLPYRRLDLASDIIQYNQTPDQYVFDLKPILPKQGAQKLGIISIQYSIFIAKNPQDLQSYSQCGLEQNSKNILKGMFLVSDNFNNTHINAPKISIQNQNIKKLLQDSINKLFVNAVAVVKLVRENVMNYPQSLHYIYSTSEILISFETPLPEKSFDWKFIVLFVVLPFLVGSLFLMLACRFCIKRIYSSYYPTELIEADNEFSQDTLKNKPGVEK